MGYEVLQFSAGTGSLDELQKELNDFFGEYSESIEVVDISYHTVRYETRSSGSERYSDGHIYAGITIAMVTIKKLYDIDLSKYH